MTSVETAINSIKTLGFVKGIEISDQNKNVYVVNALIQSLIDSAETKDQIRQLQEIQSDL